MHVPSRLPVFVPTTAKSIDSSLTPGTPGRSTNSSRCSSPPASPAPALPGAAVVVLDDDFVELPQAPSSRHTTTHPAMTRPVDRDTGSPFRAVGPQRQT